MSEGSKEDQPIPQQSLWSRLSDRAKSVYAIGAAVSAAVASLLGAYYWVTPTVSITPGVIGSNTDPFQTEFSFKNEGHVTLYNMDIECNIFKRGINVKTADNFLFIQTEPCTNTSYLFLLIPHPQLVDRI